MARDRQRAKQRKQRREPATSKRDDAGNGLSGLEPDPQPLHRENVPGPVEHTGDVDEFEAALVSGADGEPDPDPGAADRASTGETEAVSSAPVRRAAVTPAEDARGRGGGRFLNFLRASWAELQRVQWPDRRQVGQATAVVIGFVIVAGAFLGFADFVAQRIVDLIL